MPSTLKTYPLDKYAHDLVIANLSLQFKTQDKKQNSVPGQKIVK
jgi:hypothetical protein